MQDPRDFLGEIVWKEASSVVMRSPRNLPPDSNEAVSWRLKVLRYLHNKDNQSAFAVRVGIEVKRWNNFERNYPLSKDAAFQIVRKFPDVTTDWLWFGKTGGVPPRLQAELEAAEAELKAKMGVGRSGAKTG